MRKLYIIAIFAILLITPKLALAGGYNFSSKVLNPKSSGYETLSLNQFKGKVVVVNFWATWCPPCRAELPLLENFSNEYKSRVVIIGVNVNLTESGVKRFVDEHNITYPVIHATPSIINPFGHLDEIPQSFFFNQQGKMVFHWNGGMSGMVINTVVSKLLAGGKQ